MKVPFMDLWEGISELYTDIIDKLSSLIRNTQFIGGEEVELFEKEFASFNHAKFAVGCSNGTDALILSLKAVGIKKGDTVLVPVNTFIATSEAVTAVGGISDFIENGVDGFYFDKYIPDPFVDFLSNWIENPSSYKDIPTKASNKAIETFNESRLIKDIENLYLECLKHQ